MLAVPSSDWSEDPDLSPPFAAAWTDAGEVRHTFTHFHLRLAVRLARLAQLDALRGDARPLAEATDDMPTVFAKVLRLVAPLLHPAAEDRD